MMVNPKDSHDVQSLLLAPAPLRRVRMGRWIGLDLEVPYTWMSQESSKRLGSMGYFTPIYVNLKVG